MRRLALAGLLCAAVLAPGSAQAARFSVGIQKGADQDAVARRLEAAARHPVTKIGSFALSVQARKAAKLRSVPGVSWVERDRASRRIAFSPNDPLAVRQWYLGRVHAFDAWPQFPSLQPVRVAVLDSGVDSAHPELQNQIADGRSFVNGTWESDTNGHGTFVAGEIAAAINNNLGIAGVAFPADLLIAKIVRSDGTISPESEARAIHWAVARGARVINMSFGGVRDPRDPSQDTYSQVEAAAVQYAVSKGVLVVAAVGNSDGAPTEPWGYAGYPAALPHVLGVSSISRDGTVPNFSNRDVRYDDIAAPGEGILSTLPKALTSSSRPGCFLQGYSDCGPIEFRRGEGTSFSAPLVSAAAALLFATDPGLQSDQASNLLTRYAADATPDTGCLRCIEGRDSLTGWGLLDIGSAVRALDDPLPEGDRYEINDQVANAPELWGRKGQRIRATIDYWDDRQDVYKVRLRAGQRFVAKLRGPAGTDTNLFVWKPGTKTIRSAVADYRFLAGQSKSPGSQEKIRVTVTRTGWYYLVVRSATPGSGKYGLRYRKRFPKARAAARP
jgi:subtilisin family serine protease